MSPASRKKMIRREMAELFALQGGIDAVRDRTLVVEARVMAGAALALQPQPKTLTAAIVWCAMAHIARNRQQLRWSRLPQQGTSSEACLTDMVGRQWLSWRTGQPNKGTHLVVIDSQVDMDEPNPYYIAALEIWQEAVAALIEGRTEHASVLWREALHLGSEVGAPMHPIVAWTYIATFIEEP